MVCFYLYLCLFFIYSSLLPSIYSHASMNISLLLFCIYPHQIHYITDLIPVSHSSSICVLLELFDILLCASLLITTPICLLSALLLIYLLIIYAL